MTCVIPAPMEGEAWTLMHARAAQSDLTPLHLAAEKGNVKVVRCLLQHNANAFAQTDEVRKCLRAKNFGTAC